MEDIASFIIGHIIRNIPIIVVTMLAVYYRFKASDLQEQIEHNDEMINAKDTIIKDQEKLIDKQKTLMEEQLTILHKKLEGLEQQYRLFN
ncbi:hypothetical protein [Bartonella machadoae]|uniref:hypothetical protein n=1 Tax=Bartonella machadoae TaxID=2893471 RepID=UPI001F4D0C6E|nr:hypothetical protein [Bartonella machadoae]UNE54924.1 hypothetical protein LNM86_03455 [Bartonella machadoae]UNE55334.1 hypothetical protein LNM86_05880 [Bartonella machadoae]